MASAENEVTETIEKPENSNIIQGILGVLGILMGGSLLMAVV